MLQLDHYFFTNVHIKAQPDFRRADQPAKADQDIETRLRFELLRHKEEPTRFQLTLGIDRLEVKGRRKPYDITCEVVGLFSVRNEPKQSNVEKRVNVEGASLLYCAAREFILIATSRGPHGPFHLPLVDFTAVITDEEEKRPQKSSVQPKK